MPRSLKALVSVGLLLASMSADAFRSTKAEGFTDPDFKGYTFSKVMIWVQNASIEARSVIEERLTADLKSHGVVAVSYRALLPPTRTWSPEDTKAVLTREQITAILIVSVGVSAASVIPVATQTFGHATVSGTVNSSGNAAAINATGFSQSTSVNIMHAKSSAEFSAVLVDAPTGRTAWYVDITTKARGTLFVGEKGDAKAVAEGIIEGLEKDAHLSDK